MTLDTPLATDEERLTALWEQPASPATTSDASAERAINELSARRPGRPGAGSTETQPRLGSSARTAFVVPG